MSAKKKILQVESSVVKRMLQKRIRQGNDSFGGIERKQPERTHADQGHQRIGRKRVQKTIRTLKRPEHTNRSQQIGN